MAQKLKGKVISAKMNRTLVVEVTRLKQHPTYRKYIKISKRFKAHSDESVEEGKTVIIESTRPISREKKWKVIKVI